MTVRLSGCWKGEQLLELCKLPNPTPNDIGRIEQLLQEHVNVNSTCSQGMTPLMYVCWKNCGPSSKQLIQLLIDYGANVNIVSHDKWTALHVLCRYNQSDRVVDIIRSFLECRIDVNAANEKGTTALQLLARHNHSGHLLTLFELLLRRKANASATSRDGYTVLHQLCQHNQSDQLLQVVDLLLKHGADVAAQTLKGLTALHLLCRYNQSPPSVDILRLLLTHRTTNPIVSLRDVNEWTALHFACRYNHSAVLVDVLNLLAEHRADFGAKVNQRDLNVNPAHNTRINPNLLQRVRRSVSLRYNSTALHFLCRYNHTSSLPEAIRIVLQQSNDVNAVDENGRTALHLLCRHNQSAHLLDVVKTLIERHSDIHSKDNQGLTPVDCLAINGTGQFHQIFQHLVGVEPNLTFGDDLALQVAKFGCTYWANYLVKRLQVNVYDAFNKNASDYLRELKQATRSFQLCPECRTKDCVIAVPSRSLRRKTVAARSFSRSDQQVNFPAEIDTQFYDYKEEFPFEIPSYDQWNALSTSWHDDRVGWTRIDQYLRSNSHEHCKAGCYWCQVSTSVLDYVKTLMSKLQQVDARFQVKQLVEYGSAAERTRILSPNEFDFGFVLDKFVQSESSDKDVVYTWTDDVRVFYLPERSANGRSISSARLLFYFQKLMTFLVQQEAALHIFSPHVSYSETCVTIHFIYRGRRPALRISVDITLLVKMQQHFEVMDKFSDICQVTRPDERRQYLVPFRRKQPSSWKASYPSVERDTILSAGDTVRRVIRLIKLMVVLEQTEPGVKEISTKSNRTTYAIKTCLLNYLKANPHYRKQCWSLHEQLIHCIAVLKLFPAASGGQLLSFFNGEIVQDIDGYSSKTISNIIGKLERLAIRSK